jgi:hypothetical protein
VSIASRTTTLVLLITCGIVVGIAAISVKQLVSSGSAESGVALTLIPSHSSIAEGPGGRVALTRWIVREDPSDRGLRLGFADGKFTGRQVGVPDALNAMPVTGLAGKASYQGSLAWYRTRFDAPATGLYAISFQSANFLATIWVDGHRVGSHRGSYLPFEFHPHLRSGAHTLVVRVDWRDPVAQAQAGFHSTWFNFGGINGEASVRRLAASELIDPSIYTTLQPDSPHPNSARVRLAVAVHNNGPAREISPRATLSHASKTIPVRFPARIIQRGQTVTLHSTVTITRPALWSPADPNLYQLRFAIGYESSYSARVGLRQLTWAGGRMYLNGQHLVLHGASIPQDARGHGDALTAADEDTLVAELKAIGANATRSQHALEPSLLERLDAAGILVWQGVGPVDPAGGWSAQTPSLMRQAERRVQTTVVQDRLHPSIIAWNLANEVAGNGHHGGQAQYVQRMAHWLHSHDPGRIVAVDVWGDHPPRHPGALYGDVDAVSETDYAGWYDSPWDSPQRLIALIRYRLRAMHRRFRGKVQIISEFGAEANSLNATDSPGGYDFQARLLTEHITVYEHDPQLSGMLIWNLRDFALTPTFAGGSISRLLPQIRLVKGLDQKGLFSYEGESKPSAATVARLFKALPRG